MAQHNELGKKGEELALAFLKEQGFSILETNWRYKKAEVDIIGMDGDILVFVEVKTRSTQLFGEPEEFIDSKKQALIAMAGAEYMAKINHDWEIRFDVISIILKPGYPMKLKHIKDAFFPGLA